MSLLLAMFACVPVAVLPPPTPLATGASEIGLGVSYTIDEVVDRALDANASAETESWLNTPFAPTGGLDAEIYYRYRIGSNFEAGLLAFYGQGGGGPGGGVYARVPFKLSKKLSLGLDGQIGLLWYAVGLPVSYKVSKGFYVTTEPMYRAGTAVFPLGVTYKPGGGWSLGAQGMYLYTPAHEDLGTVASGRFAAALTVGYRLGKDEEDDNNDDSGGKKKKDGKKKDGKKKGGGDGKGDGTNR